MSFLHEPQVNRVPPGQNVALRWSDEVLEARAGLRFGLWRRKNARVRAFAGPWAPSVAKSGRVWLRLGHDPMKHGHGSKSRTPANIPNPTID